MNRYIITFGQDHAHRVNDTTFDKDCVAVVKAETEGEAHRWAMEAFDRKFHRCIPEEYFNEEGYAKHFPRGKFPANFKEVENEKESST